MPRCHPSETGVKILLHADPMPELAANKRGSAGERRQAAGDRDLHRPLLLPDRPILDGMPDEIVDATEAFERLAAWVAKGARKGGAKPAAELPQAFVDLLADDDKP